MPPTARQGASGRPTAAQVMGGDDELMRAQLERVLRARRRWWVELAVKAVMWVIGAYTVRLLHKENLKIYLIVSALAYILLSVVREDGRRARQARQEAAEVAQAERAGAAIGGRQHAAEHAGMNRRQRRMAQRAGGAAAAPGHRGAVPARPEAPPPAATAPVVEEAPPPAPTVPAEEEPADARPAALLPKQQLSVLRAMRGVGTPAAMRCVGDAEFRQRVLDAQLGLYDQCVCGSGEPFARCCRSVQASLAEALQ